MIKNTAPELLSPVGSMESLYAAVNNGCDAVYLGGKSFSARQYANNFGIKELEEVCDYCHLRGIKVYITVNTIYKDEEINEFLKFIDELYKIGVDALIVQDLGAAEIIRKRYPDFTLHASTQLTTNSLEDVQYLYNNGFSKVVLSRELSLDEIKYITDNTDVEIETFVHGALCVSYSGQCIMSSMLGGRSGNRGRCAQTCRLPYTLYNEYDKIKEGHLLCPKDIETITILPKLIKAGIRSFKIEGRMKSPEYVAGVTQVYRKYIDMYMNDPENYAVDDKDMKILLQLFNRGGFTEGYYETHSGSSMMSIERPKTWGLKTGFVDTYNPKIGRVTIRTREPLVPGDGIEIWTDSEPHVGSNINKKSKAGEVISLSIEGDISKNNVVYKTHDKLLEDTLRATWEKDRRKKGIYGEFTAIKGEPLSLKLWDDNGAAVYVTGAVVEKAQNQPMTEEKLRKQISKTGATPFEFEYLDIKSDDDIYVGISDLNDIRRRATDKLSETIIKKTKRKPVELEKFKSNRNRIIRTKKITVLVNDIMQFDIVTRNRNVDTVYFELTDSFEKNIDKCIERCKKTGVKLFAALPRIYRVSSKKLYSDFIEKLKQSDIDGFLVRSLGEYDMVCDSNKKIAVDYNMNVFNSEAVRYWNDKNVERICVSPELNIKEINNIADENCEMLGYGYIPLMTTHQCPIGSFDGGKEGGMYCSKRYNKDLYFLKDRKGMKFPLMPDCKQCVCQILNGKPLFTLKFYDEVSETSTGYIRLLFTKEGPKKTERILNAYCDVVLGKNISPETKILLNEMSEKGSTKGHFFRGVE